MLVCLSFDNKNIKTTLRFSKRAYPQTTDAFTSFQTTKTNKEKSGKKHTKNKRRLAKPRSKV